eukprot:2942502-Pyramimonas_sp.AAC.1
MGAADTVWRQSLLSEAGIARGQCAVPLLRDFYKYDETLSIDQVLARCHRLGFSLGVARLACQ